MKISIDFPTDSDTTSQRSSNCGETTSLKTTCKPEPQTKPRRKYAKYSLETRSAVVDAYERGDDWMQVAQLHGVKRKTAWDWISSPEPRRIPQPRNKIRKKAFTENQSMLLLEWLSDEPRITLHQIAEKVQNQFGKTVSLTTIGRYIVGKLYTVKKECRTVKESTSIDDQQKQRNLVEQLKASRFLGRNIIWIDEVTLSLVCVRHRGPDKKRQHVGCTAAHVRGKTIQLAVAMSRHGILNYLVKKGVYTMDHCLEFVQGLIEKLKMESSLDNGVFVYDDAPCHSKLDELIKKEKLKVIRLVPYSSELNPIERLWDQTRTQMRRQLQETHERLLQGDSETFDHQDPLMECLEQCANAFLTCVSGEHCGQLVDDVLHPLTEIDLKPVIKPE